MNIAVSSTNSRSIMQKLCSTIPSMQLVTASIIQSISVLHGTGTAMHPWQTSLLHSLVSKWIQISLSQSISMRRLRILPGTLAAYSQSQRSEEQNSQMQLLHQGSIHLNLPVSKLSGLVVVVDILLMKPLLGCEFHGAWFPSIMSSSSTTNRSLPKRVHAFAAMNCMQNITQTGTRNSPLYWMMGSQFFNLHTHIDLLFGM